MLLRKRVPEVIVNNRINAIKKSISTFAIAALLLTGSAPYFAFAQTENDAGRGTEVKSLATYDDSKVPQVGGASAILMSAENGDIIYEKNAHVVREPASVTKILNLLVVLDHLDMDQEVTIPEGTETRGSTSDLETGERMTVRDLVYCMMLESGNDAAEVLGELAGGDLKTFAKMMNEKAKECGATATNYKNPNGLNEVADQLNYTTAYDQAVITREVMKNDTFREVVSSTTYTIPKTNKSKARKLRNTNACLWKLETLEMNGKQRVYKYEGCTGVKTGYTSSAGDCFVGTAKRGNLELIAVTLRSTDYANRFGDAIKLWDYGFDHYKNYTAVKADKKLCEQKVRRGALAEVRIGTAEDLDITMDIDYADADGITTKIKLNEEKPTAPISKGQALGTISAYDAAGDLVAYRGLVALEKVEKGGPLSYIGIPDEYLGEVFFLFALVVGTLLVIVILLRILGRKKRNRKKGWPGQQTQSKRQARPGQQTQPRQQARPARTEAGREIDPPLSTKYKSPIGPTVREEYDDWTTGQTIWAEDSRSFEEPVGHEQSRPIYPPMNRSYVRPGAPPAGSALSDGEVASSGRTAQPKRRKGAAREEAARHSGTVRREKRIARKRRKKRREKRNVRDQREP